ncbi:cytochrome P450 [Streptomonospora nanhaiensis]|uniref:cytochrome P450 n=1 Tax=Streptomonospora nanhaiensis TaxID=1323731 RepID=UPI001C387B47|nr:cytochrome P450 [Streptomonospora nanhaiensis]MBV2365249.1 cytochrome P450 [Streptomonospora nanhaiensis]
MTAERTEQPRQPAGASVDEMLFGLMMRGDIDPYPVYAWLRENAPVAWSGGFNAYVVSGYADCDQVLRDHEVFRAIDEEMLAALFPQAAQHEAYRIFQTSLVGHNPPGHTRLRRLVSREFTPRRINGMRPEIERVCARLLDRAQERMRAEGSVDLHREVSVPLPMHVLARLLGIPEADLPHVSALVPRMLHVVDPAAGEEQLTDADAAFAEFGDYLDVLVAQRRREPRSDLLSGLVSVHDEDGDRLSGDELRTMVFTLWAAGFETPAIAADNGVAALLAHPEHAHWLDAEETAGAFVDELLRWETPGPVAAARRYTAVDTRIGGVAVPAGREVRLLIGSANRDPRRFPDPDRFDPARAAANPLMFGAGIHYCLGAGLARLEITVLLRELRRRFPGLRAAAEPVRRRSIPLREFSSFIVTADNR